MDWGERKRTVLNATVPFYVVLWEVTEYLRTVVDKEVAEGEGFEPSIRFPAYTLSKRAPSATRPPLQVDKI